MLTRRATPELVKEWKETYSAYRPLLRPGRKTGREIIAYLTGKYPVHELSGESISEVIADNLLLNEFNARKLPPGTTPEAVGFLIGDTNAGTDLYAKQDAIFRGKPIIVGIDLVTGYFMVEGSSLLWDELFAFRGLDGEDLENYYLVAEYIACLRQSGLLERVLAGRAP